MEFYRATGREYLYFSHYCDGERPVCKRATLGDIPGDITGSRNHPSDRIGGSEFDASNCLSLGRVQSNYIPLRVYHISHRNSQHVANYKLPLNILLLVEASDATFRSVKNEFY